MKGKSARMMLRYQGKSTRRRCNLNGGCEKVFHYRYRSFFILAWFALAGSLGATTGMAVEPQRVEIHIEGLEGDVMANVQAALTLPAGLVQNGTIDTLWLERFIGRIPENVRKAMEPFGYFDPRITVTQAEGKAGVHGIVVTVDPGQPSRLAGVSVALAGPGSDEKMLKQLVLSFPLVKGDVFLQKKYEDAKGSLKAQAVVMGYLDADYSKHEIRISPDRTSADITLVLDTGPQYRFGSTSFQGAPDYPDSFLRRFLAFKEGDVFSYPKIAESQLNFSNADRFKQIIITPERKQAENLMIPLVVHLQQDPLKELRPGVGYATDTGPRFSLRYRDRDVFKKGHDLRTELNISNLHQGLAANYTIPGTGNISTVTGIQVAYQQESTVTYYTRSLSLEVNETKGFSRGRLGSLYVNVLHEESTIASQRTRSMLVVPGVRFSGRRQDNLIRPTRGLRYSLDVRGTNEVLGSDTHFSQVVAEGYVIEPLPWRLSLITRINAGYTISLASLSNLPASYRFFAGGDRSVRGYAYQSLGPRDATGAVVGGEHLFTGTIEFDRALFKNWAVAAFYDAGNAFNGLSSIRLFEGAGTGVRYYTRVGVIQLDVARQLNVVRPGYRVHFTMGLAL
jgi:translocation and assembly module TamA